MNLRGKEKTGCFINFFEPFHQNFLDFSNKKSCYKSKMRAILRSE
jgi:hypothetical protein